MLCMLKHWESFPFCQINVKTNCTCALHSKESRSRNTTIPLTICCYQLLRINQENIQHSVTTQDIKFSLTAELYPDKVPDAQIFQENSRGRSRFKQERDVCIQLSLKGGEVKVGRLLIKKRSIPEVLCKTEKNHFFNSSHNSFHALGWKTFPFSFQKLDISLWNKAY